MVVDVLDVGGVVGGGYEVETPAVRKLDGLPLPVVVDEFGCGCDRLADLWREARGSGHSVRSEIVHVFLHRRRSPANHGAPHLKGLVLKSTELAHVRCDPNALRWVPVGGFQLLDGGILQVDAYPGHRRLEAEQTVQRYTRHICRRKSYRIVLKRLFSPNWNLVSVSATIALPLQAPLQTTSALPCRTRPEPVSFHDTNSPSRREVSASSDQRHEAVRW